jgi:hypothetical protein
LRISNAAKFARVPQYDRQSNSSFALSKDSLFADDYNSFPPARLSVEQRVVQSFRSGILPQLRMLANRDVPMLFGKGLKFHEEVKSSLERI